MANHNMTVLVVNMMLVALVTLVTCVNTAETETGIDRECKARPVLFKLASGRNHYVELHRCLGHTLDQVHHRCVNTTYSTVKVTQTDSIMYNHTQCAMRCACNTGELEDKTCVSPNSNVFCYPGQKWDPTICVCVNVARAGPIVATSTKQSESRGGGVSWTLFVFSLIAELVVVVAISYCINRPKNKIRKTTDDEEDDIPVFNSQISTQQYSNVVRRLNSKSSGDRKEGSICLLDAEDFEDAS